MSEFYPGQRVIYVDDSSGPNKVPGSAAPANRDDLLVLNREYIVRSVSWITWAYNPFSGEPSLGLKLEGIYRPNDFHYDARRFRPAQEKKQEEKLTEKVDIFRKIAQDVTDGKVVEIV